MGAAYTIFHFIVAIGILIAIHEFGHFWVARKAGVRVLRFSIGFGKVIWSFQKNADSTEYVICSIPLGGYVKMLDEREGEVKTEDLPYAFNRQSLKARSAIVAAGPIFNLILAVLLFWVVFMVGETGIRPIVGTVEPGTLAAEAGFVEGEEIYAVNDKRTPTWTETMNVLFSSAMQGDQDIQVSVKDLDDIEKLYFLHLTDTDTNNPKAFYKQLGLKPWTPKLKPVIGKVIENSPAALAGLKKDDLVISADGVAITEWMQWVEYVRSHPEQKINIIVERGSIRVPLQIIPERVENEDKNIGHIGAGVDIPEELIESLKVIYSLPPGEALVAALKRTWNYSASTLIMMGRILIGSASTDNLSGPISIAQFAGRSAERGIVSFLKFLAIVSVSLGVINLLPVPVLDGGHLMFFAIEAIKGSPVSDRVQIYFQQVGIFLLMTLMIFVVSLDLERMF